MNRYSDSPKLGILYRHEDLSSPLPLESTRVEGEIIGPIAGVKVIQQFSNPYQEPVNLEYLFPLPHQAAIYDYQIIIGNRLIRAEILEIVVAHKMYHEAIDKGHRASLLEERRPNLYAIQLGNVQPGDAIETIIQYQERLHYSDDGYEFVFPMGITPKYHTDPQEASKVDAQLALGEERVGEVQLTLTIDAGVKVSQPTSPSHSFGLTSLDDRRFRVAVNTLPHKDFVMRYGVASDDIQTSLWLSKGQDADTALITILPSRMDHSLQPPPREFIFVLDRSGSMSGEPIRQARNALCACLRTLNPDDTFAIVAFDDRVEWLSRDAMAVTQATVEKADQWLHTVEGRNGTEIIPAIQAGLALPTDSARQRYFVLLTDGAVSAEAEVLRLVRANRGNSRIFTFGIGPSVNRALLIEMARIGRGGSEFLQLTEDIERAIIRFADRISYPTLQDIQLNWGDTQVWDTYPTPLPDLYIGQPLQLVTRLKPNNHALLKLTGQRGEKTVELSVRIPPAEAANSAINWLWAKARIDALSAGYDETYNIETARQMIIALALEHRLLTPYTGFIAVDSEVSHSNTPIPVKVSVPLPEGLDIEVFAVCKVAMDWRTNGVSWDEETYNVPIESLDLRVRVFNALQRTGITTVGEVLELLDRGPDAMLAIRNFGERSLDELVNQLKQKGYLPTDEKLSVDNTSAVTLNSHPVQDDTSQADTIGISQKLRELARIQNVSGSWGNGAYEIEMTAVALLTFVRADHTTQAGDHRHQLRKAVEWLRQTSAQGFDACIRWRAFVELQHAEGNRETLIDKNSPAPLGVSAPELAAVFDTRVSIPQEVRTLDDVRVLALMNGDVEVPPSLYQGNDAGLIAVWATIGKPMVS